MWKTGKISAAETAFLDALERHGVIVVRQRRLGRYAIDGFVPEWNLAIEVDGAYWHSLPEMVARDVRKDRYLRTRGLKVARIVVGRERPDFNALASAMVNEQRGGAAA